jgi:hypothetical protein
MVAVRGKADITRTLEIRRALTQTDIEMVSFEGARRFFTGSQNGRRFHCRIGKVRCMAATSVGGAGWKRKSESGMIFT